MWQCFRLANKAYSQLITRGFSNNTRIGNSSISIFVKSGSSENARRVFMELCEPNLVLWNSIIVGYGQFSFGIETIMLFDEMQKTRFLPDRISFLDVLQGCAHCGLVEEGKYYFQNMMVKYGVIPGPEHYATIADLFARKGMLKEAYAVVVNMPHEPTPVFWRILLNGCRFSNVVSLRFCIGERVLKFEPCSPIVLEMMFEMNILAGRSIEVTQLRRKIRDGRNVKQLDRDKGKTHSFATNDETHLEFAYIYRYLELLSYDMAVQIGSCLTEIQELCSLQT